MKKQLFFTVFFSFFLSTLFAQRTPTHPLDIKQGMANDFAEFFDQWEPGTPPLGTDDIDDQFYISRVRPLSRIADHTLKVRDDVDSKRKMGLWVPLDEPTGKWKGLPRYCFEGDNFSMWSYVDIHGNWSAPWLRLSAGVSDVSAKNGVKTGCVFNIKNELAVDHTKTDNTVSTTFGVLLKQDAEGNFVNAEKFVKLMKYYGINGVGQNSEYNAHLTTATLMQDFFVKCHEIGAELGWDFQVHWYNFMRNSGTTYNPESLTAQNVNWFHKDGKPVSDLFFLNYNWSDDRLKKSVELADSKDRSSYDIYAGLDIQGRGLRAGQRYSGNKWVGWSTLLNHKVSIGFWGSHAQSSIHENATDDGSEDIAIQKAYLIKQERTFSGGNRNPANLPAISEDRTFGNTSLKEFHGLARYISARSTLHTLPFVTRFNLGNGLFFNNEGDRSFDHKWYNIGMQDFLPNWRWWITNADDKVEGDLIEANFVFDDAWFGGSCLKFSGKTNFSRVRLFKTQYDVKSSTQLSLTYKVLDGIAPKAKVFLATKANLSEFKEIELPAVEEVDKWKTVVFSLSELGITTDEVISLMGLSFDGTDSNHALLLGELSLMNPEETFEPVKPTIKKVEILRSRYNETDFKIRYESKNELAGEKTYNDEVATWYFEIFFEQEGEKEQLLTTTTSWAAYVIDAPTVLRDGVRKARVGVRAVAPDGKKKSEIAWSEYLELPYTPVEKVLISKPVIKSDESFKVYFEDPMHVSVPKWEIKDPLADEIVFTDQNKSEITLSLEKEGLYDLYVTSLDHEGNEFVTITRGFIQITPEETGSVPEILSLEASKTNPDQNEAIQIFYKSKDGEGTVSRSLKINDPNMFVVPAEAHPSNLVTVATNVPNEFSYALWFKAEQLVHEADGTNLINKNSSYDEWPHNNWGDLWVQIRPEQKKNDGTHLCNLNEISLNFMGWEAHGDPDLLSKDISITVGVWNHLVIMQTADKTKKLYLNGKKVSEGSTPSTTRVERSKYDSRVKGGVNANIYFGGSSAYKTGFDGWLDEVQIWNKALSDDEVVEAMKGYKPEQIPDALLAYYTFEEKNADYTFANKGKGGADLIGRVVIRKGNDDVTIESNNDELGYPGIPGSLDIKTSEPKWSLIGSETVSSDANSITVKYASDGAYDAGVSIENRWGKGELVKAKYIKIGNVPEDEPETPVTGIEQILDEVVLSVYPNPFAEMLHLNFSKGGKYAIQISSLTGKVLSADLITVSDNENIQLRVDAEAGVYILQVKKDGKVYKTLKLVKK